MLMSCKACSKRAFKLLTQLGFIHLFVGAVKQPVAVLENEKGAILFTGVGINHFHLRVAIISLVWRLLFGKHRTAASVTQSKVDEWPKDPTSLLKAAPASIAMRQPDGSAILYQGEWFASVQPQEIKA